MAHNAEDTMSDCVRLSASYEKIATSFLGSLGTFTTQTMDNTEHYGWHGCGKKSTTENAIPVKENKHKSSY